MAIRQFDSLPIVGEQLVKLRFCGNGKDSEVTIETAGQRKSVIPLSDAEMDLRLSGRISIAAKGWGDTAITWEIAPRPEQCIRIEEAAVGFQGDRSEWKEALRSYERTGTFHWAVALRLKLSSTDGSDTRLRLARPESKVTRNARDVLIDIARKLTPEQRLTAMLKQTQVVYDLLASGERTRRQKRKARRNATPSHSPAPPAQPPSPAPHEETRASDRATPARQPDRD
jgi:hypothetical protein